MEHPEYEWSVPVDHDYDLQGFCEGFPLRRHLYEELANDGGRHVYQDWIKYFGPIGNDVYGSVNFRSGNFCSVVLPFTKPERLAMVTYCVDYAFYHDAITDQGDPSSMETVNKLNDEICGSLATEVQSENARSENKRKQLQARMISEVLAHDLEAGQHFFKVWKEAATVGFGRDKIQRFQTLEDYLQYRVVDAGAIFTDGVMLFGMGMVLSKEEVTSIAHIQRAAWIVLSLNNDYHSFDIEYESFKQTGATTITNLVWLMMQWHKAGVDEAKNMVKEVTIRYEKEFWRGWAEFQKDDKIFSPKLQKYLTAVCHEVKGNFVWSMDCPRYHPDRRYDQHEAFGHSTVRMPPGLEDFYVKARDILRQRGTPLNHSSPVYGLSYKTFSEHKNGYIKKADLETRENKNETAELAVNGGPVQQSQSVGTDSIAVDGKPTDKNKTELAVNGGPVLQDLSVMEADGIANPAYLPL